MSFNLKDILNPKTCDDCKFFNDEHESCTLNVFTWYPPISCYDGFNPCDNVHRDCSLLRIKCENCKHSKQWPDGCYYCTKEGADCLSVACIEFEEVK